MTEHQLPVVLAPGVQDLLVALTQVLPTVLLAVLVIRAVSRLPGTYAPFKPGRRARALTRLNWADERYATAKSIPERVYLATVRKDARNELREEWSRSFDFWWSFIYLVLLIAAGGVAQVAAMLGTIAPDREKPAYLTFSGSAVILLLGVLAAYAAEKHGADEIESTRARTFARRAATAMLALLALIGMYVWAVAVDNWAWRLGDY